MTTNTNAALASEIEDAFVCARAAFFHSADWASTSHVLDVLRTRVDVALTTAAELAQENIEAAEHNFWIIQNFDQWLLQQGHYVVSHTEEKDGPQAFVLNWIASVTSMLAAAPKAEPAKRVQLPLAITSAPERIWLDLGFNPYEEDAHFSNLHDLTWSKDNATGDGIEYIRADRAMRAQAAPQPAVQQGTDIGPLGQRTILDAIRSAYDLGYSDARNARTHPGDSAPGYKGRDVEKDHGGALIAKLNVLAARPHPAAPVAQGDALTQAARDVLAERQRQISAEGWTPANDDGHEPGSLSEAAGCYAMQAYGSKQLPALWPWAIAWWKPSDDPRRNLEKAGALILAEMERIDRAAARSQAKEGA